MKKKLFFCIISFLVSCVSNTTSNDNVLKIKCICAMDIIELQQYKIENNQHLVLCKVENTIHDTLFIPAYHFKPMRSWMIMAAEVENYEIVDNTYEMVSFSTIYTPIADTIIKVSREESLSVFLRAACPGNKPNYGFIHYLHFDYDSSGIKKPLIMNYANFDTIVPVKYINYFQDN